MYRVAGRGLDPNAFVGISQMSMAELYRRAAVSTSFGGTSIPSSYDYSSAFHLRCALAGATGVMGLLALAAMPRRRTRVSILCAMSLGVCFAYWLLLYGANRVARSGALPAFVALWLPNAACIAAALVIHYWRVRSKLPNHQIAES